MLVEPIVSADNAGETTPRPRLPASRIKISGEGRQETKRSAYLLGQTGYAMGHVERPLAEVFSGMPRCAPLRLPQGEASGGPFSRPCQHALGERKRVAFAFGRKLLLLFTKSPSSTRPISIPGVGFALLRSSPAIGSWVQEFVRAPRYWAK